MTASAVPAPPTAEDELWSRILNQESRLRPGVIGPPTQYGQAEGEAQTMVPTAREMAAKLGLPWRPDMLTGTNQQAEDYQLAVGRAYFDQGWQKYGGDPAKAAAYYYGGPNEKHWGPKTREYVRTIMGGNDAALAAPSGAVQGLMAKLSADPARTALVKDIGAAEHKVEAGEADYEKQLDESTAKIKKIEKQIEALRYPEAPTLPELPKAPKEIRTDPTKVLRQFLPMIAALAGLKTRAPATAVLNAMASAAEAQRKNDRAGFQEAHEAFKDNMEEMQEKWRETRERFMDVFNNAKATTEQRLAELNTIAVESGNEKLKQDARRGNLGDLYSHLQMIDAAMYQVGHIGVETARLDLEHDKTLLERQHWEQMDQAARDRIPPATKAYNESYQSALAEAKQAGKSEPEAQQIAQDKAGAAAGKVAMQVQVARRQASYRDENYLAAQLIKKGTPGEAFLALVNNESKIAQAAKNPKEYLTPSGSAIVADTFTRVFNGGFAIRGFQAKMLTSDRSVKNTLESALQKAKTGGTYTPEEIKQMADAVQRVEPELKTNFLRAADDTVRTARSRGEDPHNSIPAGLRQYVDFGQETPNEDLDPDQNVTPEPGAAAAAPPQDGWSIKPVP